MRDICKILGFSKLYKKYIMCLIAIITVFTVMLTSVSPFRVCADGNIRKITVGVPADRCPIFYCDKETGEVVGIGVDLMRIASEEAGFDASFKVIGESTLKEALDNDEYDVLLPFGSPISSASGSSTVVSDNLFQTPFTLVTVNNRKPPQLNELKVGMLSSLSGGADTVSQLYPGIEIKFFETMDESVKALRRKEVDALLHNSYVWSYVLQKPSYSDLTVQPSNMFSMDFRAGTKDTPEGRKLIAQLDKGISALPDTQRQAVILDYTGRRLYQYDVYDYLYEYGVVILLFFLLIASFVTIVILKARTFRFDQEEKMRRVMDYDQLTGVLSLKSFRSRVEELLRSNPDVPYVISYNNIQNFKYINDSLGMKAGDELLCFWAKKSMENMSDIDAFCRLEADHFATLRHLEGDGQLSEDVKKVFEPVKNYFTDQGREIHIRISTGIYALTPEDHKDVNVDQMIDYARVAEKKLRDGHKDGFEFYNTEQWSLGKLFAEVTGRLPAALRSGEIMVWYQPQVNYETGEITGAEALCRWKHTTRGWISPGKFVSALEEAGLIYDLDCFVWEKVCCDLQRWNREGKRMTVSVNLSRADLAKNNNVPDFFLKLIEKYDLTPDQLHIEITETAYVESPELLISTTQKLRKYGFKVEMDDFGSGYSSLNMLKEVQVDRIKLDMYFLTETGDTEKSRVIISHIIKMTRALGMDIIAEGVEKEEQARFIYELGCCSMQGYYYHKPMPAEDFEHLLGMG
ncbi:EAL domain-containing protein [Ruminococcus albus]|uniref:Diguanylate cyclase (GGDEF) domain-containing protein n=1 Tax=Ruminococcus albus TaxID=1264 RepID=A0A1I1D5J2_RUMAL|nr:EAL domain-containing protein [Ruminococcus albus]SFB68060.1 diguanylate cyclase (GGDEF) domain-containing protein [Ruminococcus albus]